MATWSSWYTFSSISYGTGVAWTNGGNIVDTGDATYGSSYWDASPSNPPRSFTVSSWRGSGDIPTNAIYQRMETWVRGTYGTVNGFSFESYLTPSGGNEYTATNYGSLWDATRDASLSTWGLTQTEMDNIVHSTSGINLIFQSASLSFDETCLIYFLKMRVQWDPAPSTGGVLIGKL